MTDARHYIVHCIPWYTIVVEDILVRRRAYSTGHNSPTKATDFANETMTRPMIRILLLAATALSFGRAASHDRLLQLESCDGEIATLDFNFFVELNVSDGCDGVDLEAIGSLIQGQLDFFIEYIPENKNEFIDALLCPAPNLARSDDRFLQQEARTGKYSYVGGGICARCRSNKRVYGASVSNGGRRTLKGTKGKTTKSQTEVRNGGRRTKGTTTKSQKEATTVDMEEQEKKLQSDRGVEPADA
jgi:hypothetical protein